MDAGRAAMTCRAAINRSGTLADLHAEIDWLAARMATLRTQLTEYEAELARLIQERKERTTRPAPGAGETETTDG